MPRESHQIEQKQKMVQMTLPVRTVSTILPGAPSCAVVEMRSEPRLRSQTPTFDLSFADSQRSKRPVSQTALQGFPPVTPSWPVGKFTKSSTGLLHHIITFWHMSNKQGPAMAIRRSVENVDEPKQGRVDVHESVEWKLRRSAHSAWADSEAQPAW